MEKNMEKSPTVFIFTTGQYSPTKKLENKEYNEHVKVNYSTSVLTWLSTFDISKQNNNSHIHINPYPAKLIYLIFQPLEVVARGSETQLQVAEKNS